MGYRSDVSLVLKKHDYDRLVELVCADSTAMRYWNTKEQFEEAFWSDIYVEPEDYVHLFANDIKWYGDEVDFVMDFIAGVEHEYVRVGEEPRDIEEENTFKNGENFLNTCCAKVVTPADIKNLIGMLGEIRDNIGRAIVHGEVNADPTADIVGNIVSDVQLCVIERWASQFFPGDFSGMNPKDSHFPDDEDFAEYYEAAGCPIE